MINRVFTYAVMPEIQTRWSPRAFDASPVPQEEVLALIEAASYAPSSLNDQPWRFVIASDEQRLQKMRNILMPANQAWANHAPVLILLLGMKKFSSSKRENYWHMFDTGTAWGFLQLEAQRRGLITHAMGGFKRDEALSTFGLSEEEYSPMAVIAVGRYGSKDQLSPELQKREQPSPRRSISELLL